jgi:hypothetical protein
MKIHMTVFSTVTLVLLCSAAPAMAQSGSPSPNVPKESGLPSKEKDTHRSQDSKGLSGQRSTTTEKDSITRQQEQLKHKESGK